MNDGLLDNRYRPIRRLGEGGMAEVWLAHDTRLDRPVAIKRLRPQYARRGVFLSRFEHEARVAATLDDPHIIHIYDVVVTGRANAYIVMEYVRGQDLKDYLEEAAPLPVGRALRLLREIALGVAVAHRAGLIHRDLKPANVLLSHDGHVKITDFGLARTVAGAGLTEPGTVWGTSHYVAPEQARGEPLTPATDVYGLGVILYEMLTGEVPFPGDDPIAVALAHVQQPPPDIRRRVPNIPQSVVRLLHRLLAKDPEARPRDAGELVGLLDRYLQSAHRVTAVVPSVEKKSPPRPVAPPVPRPKPPRSKRRLAALLVAGILLLSLVATTFTVRGRMLLPFRMPGIPILGSTDSWTPPVASATVNVPSPSPTTRAEIVEQEPTATASTPTVPARSNGPLLRLGNGPDLRAALVEAPVELDGRLAEWSGPGVPATTPTFGAERWNGQRDLSGEVWAAWDERALYLAVRVTDDTIVQTQRGWELYRGDSVELWLDAHLAGDFDEGEGNADDWHFGFSPGNFDDLRPEGVIYLPLRDETVQAALRVRALPSPDGYTLEARIPWEILGVEPQAGAVFGYDVDVTDNDLAGTAEEQSHVSTSPNLQWNRPSTFGNLILLP